MSSSNQNNDGAKKTSGRKKIRLEKIENKSSRRVTLSKRRDGLFKKANELAILCGAEVAIIVSSPSNKFYSYGSPSVDEITTRFVGAPTGSNRNLVEAPHRANQDQVSKLNQIMDQLRLQKKRAQEQKAKPRLNIHNKSLEELQKLQDVVIDFQQLFDMYIQNNNNSKDKHVASQNFNVGEKDILQYPEVEGHSPSAIKNMNGAAYSEVFISGNHTSLAISGSSSNSGPNRPAPHFVNRNRLSPYSFGPSSSSSHVGGPSFPTLDLLGIKCPSLNFVKTTRPTHHNDIQFPMVHNSGHTDLHGSSPSDVILYSNAGASDDEASTN